MSCGQANFIKSSSKLDHSTVVDGVRGRYVKLTLVFVFAHVDHHRGIVSCREGRGTYVLEIQIFWSFGSRHLPKRRRGP